MRVCVTGGAGFVGRRFVKRFLAMDYDVTVVDDLSTGLAPRDWKGPVKLTLDETERVKWHMTDLRTYLGYCARRFDLVLHCAAVVGGRMKIDGDPIAVATDLAIDASLFNWLVRFPPRKTIYFSSSAVYPIELQRETMHCALHESFINFDAYRIGMPDQTYGWSKLTGELLARHAARKYNLDVSIYRPFSGYGEDQDLSYPFPAIVQRVGNRERPVHVWGSGRQERDFIHIDDVVDCVLNTYARLQPGETLNIGSGVGTSFIQLAQLACRELSHEAQIKPQPENPSGVFCRVADTAKMLGFYRPKISPEDGIARCHEFQRENNMLDTLVTSV